MGEKGLLERQPTVSVIATLSNNESVHRNYYKGHMDKIKGEGGGGGGRWVQLGWGGGMGRKGIQL